MNKAIELLKRISAIADNDEPNEEHGFPLIKELSDQALALLAEQSKTGSLRITYEFC